MPQCAWCREATNQVLPELDRLIRLSQNLLSAEAIDSGSFAINMVPLDINLVLNDAANAVQFGAVAKNQKLEVRRNPDAATCLVDSERIVQVLVNLLSNAIKYSPRNTAITLTSKIENGFVRVEVIDEGPGIPEAQRNQIFEKFERATRTEVGSGIGLWVSKRLVALHGGAIGIDAGANGVGSVFWFTLLVFVESDLISAAAAM